MKNKIETYQYNKGSSLRRALIVALCLMSFQSFSISILDTLILDGRVVIIERQEQVDTVWVDPVVTPTEPEQPIKERIGLWEFGAFVGGRFSRYRSISDVSRLNPLELFLEEKGKVVIGPDLCFEVRRSWKEQIAVRTGLGLSYQGWDAANTDPAEFHDSLYRFYSPNPGELYQITQITYPDLGTETDTLSLNWSKSSFRYWSIEVPVIVSYIIPVREWGKSHHFEAGAGVMNRLNIMTKSGSVMLLNEDGEYQHIVEDNITVPQFLILGRAEIAWYYTIKRSKNTFGVRAYFQTPFRPIQLTDNQMSIQGSESGFGIFFRFFSK